MWLKEIIAAYGAYSHLAFILLQILQVIVAPIPGGAIEFLGGYRFGIEVGFLYSMIGLLIGSWLAFSLARLSFLLFLIPGFPKDALCYILGLTAMHLGIFLIISTIGRVPGTLMATLQGTKAFDHQYKIFFLLLAISALIIWVFCIYHEDIHHRIRKLKGTKDTGVES